MTYLLIVSMDIEGIKEELFNEVYDTEHIPAILKVPGVISALRYKVEPMKMNFGTEVVIMDESPDILESNEWGEAVQFGRWADEVRPYTSNRQFALRKKIKVS